MRENFNQCLDMLLQDEGGFTDNPKDPGGMTCLGITKRVYDAYYGVDADKETMRSLTTQDVSPIYKDNYWDKVSGDDLPSGVDWSVFDWAVNAGVYRASVAVQQAAGMAEEACDGVIGPKSIAAINKVEPKALIETIAEKRETFYRSLSTFDTFGKGWLRRNERTRQQALEMVKT